MMPSGRQRSTPGTPATVMLLVTPAPSSCGMLVIRTAEAAAADIFAQAVRAA